MKDNGPIALKAATDAEANIGVHEEGGENRGQYIKVYLGSVGIHEPSPWCAAFIFYRLFKAFTSLNAASNPKWLDFWVSMKIPMSGYTPDWSSWAKKTGRWVPVSDLKAGKAKVQRGDLCLFYFSTMGRIGHIGIVVRPKVGGFYSVEGNTGPEHGEYVEREGDGVYEKNRDWAELGTYGGVIRLGF